MSYSVFELCAATTLRAYLGTPSAPKVFSPLVSYKDLPANTAFFFDTNVLLGYYQMSLVARVPFYQWLSTIDGYAANQVHREFKHHAPKLQRIHRRHLQAPIKQEHLLTSKQELKEYLEQQAPILCDYPSWYQALQTLLAEAQAMEQHLQNYNNSYLKQGHGVLRQANQKSPIKVLQTLPAIQKCEYKHLKNEFNQAAALAILEENKGFGDAVAAYQYRYPNHVFPGLGDVLRKQKNSYGDYLIYHEILKWAAQNKSSSPVVFLTDDSTKGDWLDRQGNPYPHYQQHFLEQTGRTLHIHAAKPLLEEWLKIDTTTLLVPTAVQEDVEKAIWKKNTCQTMQLMTIKTVKNLLGKLWSTREQGGQNSDWQETIEYIQEATPYQSLFQLEGQLLRYYPLLIQQTLQNQQDYNQLEALKKSIAMHF